MKCTGRNITCLLNAKYRKEHYLHTQWKVQDGTLLAYSMECTGRNITCLLKELFRERLLLQKRIYTDGANNTLKNVLDGTLHMK